MFDDVIAEFDYFFSMADVTMESVFNFFMVAHVYAIVLIALFAIIAGLLIAILVNVRRARREFCVYRDYVRRGGENESASNERGECG